MTTTTRLFIIYHLLISQNSFWCVSGNQRNWLSISDTHRFSASIRADGLVGWLSEWMRVSSGHVSVHLECRKKSVGVNIQHLFIIVKHRREISFVWKCTMEQKKNGLQLGVSSLFYLLFEAPICWRECFQLKSALWAVAFWFWFHTKPDASRLLNNTEDTNTMRFFGILTENCLEHCLFIIQKAHHKVCSSELHRFRMVGSFFKWMVEKRWN